jgi:hypothetical protein
LHGDKATCEAPGERGEEGEGPTGDALWEIEPPFEGIRGEKQQASDEAADPDLEHTAERYAD